MTGAVDTAAIEGGAGPGRGRRRRAAGGRGTALAGVLTAMLAALAAGLAAPSPAGAQLANTCQWALDGECDEPGIGTGLCTTGTDSWDCRRSGNWSADGCYWARDGECDEPGIGTGLCPGGSDTSDCAAARGGGPAAPPDQVANACTWSFDGECDEPGIGTGLCRAGTDTADCREGFVGLLNPASPRAFFGADDRQYVDATEAPWRAIGRVQLRSGGYCTGTVVGPRLVLTAAHCLFAGDGSNRADPAIEFVAGADGEEEVARARIIREFVAPGFDNIRHSDTSEIDGLDWAFLELADDLHGATGMMEIRRVTARDLEAAIAGGWPGLTQAGYSEDSERRLTAHIGCRITEAFSDDTVFHQCDTLRGDSGSPLFLEEDGQWRVVAMESAVYLNENGSYDYNMAVDARAFYDTWRRLMAGQRK